MVLVLLDGRPHPIPQMWVARARARSYPPQWIVSFYAVGIYKLYGMVAALAWGAVIALDLRARTDWFGVVTALTSPAGGAECGCPHVVSLTSSRSLLGWCVRRIGGWHIRMGARIGGWHIRMLARRYHALESHRSSAMCARVLRAFPCTCVLGPLVRLCWRTMPPEACVVS